MTYGLRVLKTADDDVDEIAAFIAADSIDQAMRFYDSVNETFKLILAAPTRWPLFGLTHRKLAEVRKRSVLGFPNHLVFYRIDADMIEIMRVLQGSRDLPALFAELVKDE